VQRAAIAVREKKGDVVIRIQLRGVVREAETGLGVAGLFVKAYDKDLLFDDLLGSAVTGPGGEFEVVTESRDFRDLFERRPDVYVRVYAADRTTVLFEPDRGTTLDADTVIEVEVPRDVLGETAPERRVRIVGDDGRDKDDVAVGESLTLHVTGVRPSTMHRVEVSDDDGALFTDSLMSDAAGVLGPSVVWPLLGLEDPRTTEPVRVDEALERWAGRTISLRLTDGRDEVGTATLTVPRERRPFVVHVDDDDRVLNGFDAGERPVALHVEGTDAWESAQAFLVPRQHAWRVGDPFAPVLLDEGRPAVARVPGGERRMVVAEAGHVPPGAYDVVVRHVRYGYEDDDDLVLRADDIVTSRVTGVVIREHFMPSKVIGGGCANLQPIAGRVLPGAPYLEYSDVFQVGEDVWGALDPSALDPNHTSKMVAVYVVPHKTAAQWSMDSSLQNLAVLGGNAATPRWLTQSYCVNANLRLLWPNATQVGTYDVVADFGNNTADPMAFVPDDSYDMPLDLIDGYIAPGFRIVPDPTTDTSYPFAGQFTYTSATEGTIDVTDDFATQVNGIPLNARVYFPADVAGATLPSQISAAQPSYPVVVVVHGNSSAHPNDSYLGYDYLLEHLARNGFICASVHCNYGMYATGRARVMCRHLELLYAKFGANAANNVGLMGHSRGGEAVLAGTRLNQQEGWGYTVNAVIALAPSDWILHESLVAPWAEPFLAIYGSLDGDITGVEETAFSMYDRVRDVPKSMAFVHGACHDRFNAIWGDGDFYFGNLHANDIARVIPAATHEQIAKGYMSAFFRQHLRGETEWRGIFTGDWAPAAPFASSPGLRIPVQYKDTSPRTVDSFEGAHTPTSWQTSTIGGAVTESGLPVPPVEDDLADVDVHSPHETGGLMLRWDGTTDSVQWDVPAGQRDVTAYEVLSFRIGQRVDSASNPAGQPQDLRVTLTDGGGNLRAIRVSKLGSVPYPDVRYYNVFTKSSMSTVRIPLSAYTIHCLGVPDVDLTNVVSVRFEFAEKPTGEVAVDSIQFTD
jgi:hypothetical protein